MRISQLAHRLRRLGNTRRLLYATATIALLGTSCTESSTTPNLVSTVAITPSTSTVRAGSTVTLSAQPKDADGKALDVRAIAWSTNNKDVATVSNVGVVTAIAPGEARIAASAMGKSAVATITVTARVVASVVVTPASVSMRVGVSAPLLAQPLDVDGQVLTGRAITWSSSNPAVASVDASGNVSGVSVGATTITATSEGRSGQAAVTVTLPPVSTVSVTPTTDTLAIGTERTYSAVLRDASNTVLTGRSLVWSSNNVAVATVSSTGVVSAVNAGTATISATSEGRVGAATLVVLQRLAGAVTLTPASSTLIVGATQSLITQITDATGNLLTGRPVTYTSDAPSVATVNASGVVTAVAAGTARITASSEGKSGSATVQVIPVPVATVTVTPSSVTVPTGSTQQLTVVARSASGTALSGRTVTYTSGAPGVASVTSNGLVTGLTPGVAIILVSVDGVTATSTITVGNAPVATVSVTPVDPAINILGSVQLSATLRDSFGNSLTGRTVTWTSADENIAFVSSTGLVVGFKTGTVRITATSEGVSASTNVTVR